MPERKDALVYLVVLGKETPSLAYADRTLIEQEQWKAGQDSASVQNAS